MTREQYEKLKEYIVAVAMDVSFGINGSFYKKVAETKEKELDKLMFPEGNEG